MTDEERRKRERKLGRQLSEIFGVKYEEVMQLLGNAADVSKLTDAHWMRYQEDLLRILAPQLEQIYYEDFTANTERFGLTFDIEVGATDSLDFIRRYSFDLVSGITDTTRRGIQDAISKFYSQGDFLLEDVAQSLFRYYSPSRAELIAVTEVTRASGRELADRYGLNIVDIWLTANDDRVCPICGPRHQQDITDNIYPPAHVRCRCGIRQEIRSEDAN